MTTEDRRPKTPAPASARPVPSIKPRSRRKRTRKVLVVLLVVILAGAAGFFAYKYHQANQQAQLLTNPKAAADQQVSDLITRVGKLAVLPTTGEQPTVATVTDISKLQGQSFFDPAQNGDKVLIYTKSKLAILYRPSENKVVEVAPLNLTANQSGTSSSTSGTTQNKNTSE